MSDDEIFFIKDLREVSGANRSFALKYFTGPDTEDRIEIEVGQQDIILAEQCPQSGLWIVTAIEKTLAEANGTECGNPEWMETKESEDLHSISFESSDWRKHQEFSYWWSHSGNSERGRIQRHGRCRRSASP